MEDFTHTLRNLRTKLGLTQSEMAEKLSLSMSYIHQLEAGKRTPSSSVETLVQIMEKKLDAGLFEEEKAENWNNTECESKCKLVPVVGWAHAGDAQTYEELPESWQTQIATECKDKNAIGVSIEGDSMEPEFRAEDVLILSPNEEAYSGCLAVCKFADDGVVFRRIEFEQNLVRLIPINVRYPIKEYQREEFQWIYPVYESRRLIWKR